MAAVTRMKLGEVLMRVTRALGESTPWAWHCPLPAGTALLGLAITRGRAHRGLLLSEGGKGPKAEAKLAGVCQQRSRMTGPASSPPSPRLAAPGLETAGKRPDTPG